MLQPILATRPDCGSAMIGSNEGACRLTERRSVSGITNNAFHMPSGVLNIGLGPHLTFAKRILAFLDRNEGAVDKAGIQLIGKVQIA